MRRLGAGQRFTLSQHAQYPQAQFLTVAVEHAARNNLKTGIDPLHDTPPLEPGSYCNRFTAVPAGTALRAWPRRRLIASGAQTARVIGLADAAVSPNREHQVRVQFAWQRGTG